MCSPEPFLFQCKTEGASHISAEADHMFDRHIVNSSADKIPLAETEKNVKHINNVH